MTKQEQEPLNLDQLNDSYEIIGELAGRSDARTFLARRRSDGLDVAIAVAHAPPGDQGNALSHLAADVNLLTSLQHRSLIPVLDGRWVGADQFAVVMQRTKAPTLEELLHRREEEFGFSRIAAILREANGVLEWARERKVVHRAITPETLRLEPGSDRVSVSFATSALPASGVPGADADARCIAALARAMFTRSPAAPERAERPLAELRPGLPTRLIEETETLLQPTRAADAPDVMAYIARIAMAEALKEAEVHLEETRNAILEQQRQHKEQIEKERREHEQQLAAERKEHERQVEEQAKAFERKVADQAKAFERQVAEQTRAFERQVAEQNRNFSKEREAFERELAKERDALARERQALARERAAHAKDVAALAREREAHAQDRARLLEERARHEQLRKEERERLAAEVAALQAQARQHAQLAQQKTLEREQVLAESKRARADAKTAKAEFRKFVVAPVPVVASPTPPPAPVSVMPPPARAPRAQAAAKPATPAKRRDEGGSAPPSRWKSSWNVPAAAVGLVLLIALTAWGIRARNDAPRAQSQVVQVASARILDSAGGNVAQYQSVVPLPEVTSDTAALAATASDWTPPPRRRPRPVEPPPPPRTETPAADESAPRFIFENEAPQRRDSAAGRAPAVRVDTVFRRDTVRSASPVRRDSTPRPDTIPRRDSLSIGR